MKKLIGLALAFAILAAGCSGRVQKKAKPKEPSMGGTLIYGLTLPVSGIDPHVNASSELGIPLTSVYDTLVIEDKEGKFHPDLATSWKVSNEGRVYTFHLRKGVKFHDGTPFNAEAVKANFDRIASPETKSQKARFMLGPYDHTEVLDDYTVAVHFKRPYPAFLDAASQVYLGMASPAAFRKWGKDYQFHQVGTGPFRFVSYKERQEIVLERNPDYDWAPEIMHHKGPAYLDKILFRFYPDPSTRTPALLSGEVDVMGEIPPREAAKLEKDPHYRLIPVAVPGMSVQFFFNTQHSPTDDVRVRKAVLYALDRESMVKAVFGSYSPVAVGPLTANMPGAAKDLPKYPYDPEKARALLEEAGWKDVDGDGVLEKNGQKLRLECVVMSWGELPDLVPIMQEELKKVGISMSVKTLSFPAALEAAAKGEYHLIPFSLSGTDPSLLTTFFHSRNIGRGFNWSKVSDPQVDAWLDQADSSMEWDKRVELYGNVQRRVMKEAWVLPIRDQVNLNAASSKVHGLRYDYRGWFPWLYDVWISRK